MAGWGGDQAAVQTWAVGSHLHEESHLLAFGERVAEQQGGRLGLLAPGLLLNLLLVGASIFICGHRRRHGGLEGVGEVL